MTYHLVPAKVATATMPPPFADVSWVQKRGIFLQQKKTYDMMRLFHFFLGVSPQFWGFGRKILQCIPGVSGPGCLDNSELRWGVFIPLLHCGPSKNFLEMSKKSPQKKPLFFTGRPPSPNAGFFWDVILGEIGP